MTSNYQETYAFTNDDRAVLATLTVPIPSNEQKRVELLRQSKLTDETAVEAGFGRFTSLATRLFDMPYAAISFVEVESIYFQSKVGFEVDGMSRNDWFDAYTILPDSSEVYVIPDCSLDARFKDKAFVRGGPRIKFYAGAAIMLDDVKIGVLSIMDMQPHNHFGLEDKENLLDLGAAVAQLAKEKLQKTLNLSAERANIVVSMMHHLRTPMTSLNFATSLLCNDIQQIKADATLDPTQSETPVATSPPAIPESKTDDSSTNGELKPALFHSFESSFNEISMALNQLNVLVDSSLSLGQAIIKCSHQDSQLLSSGLAPGGTMDPRRNKFSEINLIDYLRDMFHHHLPIHNHNLDIEWIIETTELARGSHVTFPDAIMLIVISTVSHMSTESNSLGFNFSFLPSDQDDFEYPELINKMIEGKLSVKIFAKDETVPTSPTSPAPLNSNQAREHASTLPSFAAMNTAPGDSEGGTDFLTKQNFLSIDKILRAINGSSKEYIADISSFGLVEGNIRDRRTVHEFFIPCKILLYPQYHLQQGNRSHSNSSSSVASPPTPAPQRVRLYRPPASNTFGLNDAGIKETYENAGIMEETTGGERNMLLTAHELSNAETSETTKPSASAAPSVSPVPPQKTLRVLVIEDTIPVQKLLTRWLQNHGCEVTCANNGKVGLDYLMSQPFDITFVDFLMPVMLGITTMKLYQEFANAPTPETEALIESNKELLIVGMSATALESEQEEAFNYGMHFFCPKPVSLELLTIVLQAKREFNVNEEAVDRIVKLMNVGGEEVQTISNGSASVDEATSANAAEQPETNHATVSTAPVITQIGGSTADGKEEKNRWILFRSKPNKVHPNESK